MKKEIESKLNQITDIWNDFIWQYKSCQRVIRFTEEMKTNYFGDIIGYFQDTTDLIFNYSESHPQAERFSKQISLLQSIYVQQDLIEELLRVFNLNINKGNLKKDPNYTINRDIRNELVGHPIRRYNGNGPLLSSCLFGYNGENDTLTYLKYHRDNKFEFELLEFAISEIISRHNNFIQFYFDKILHKLKSVLKKFNNTLVPLNNLIDTKSFSELLQVSTILFESIFESNYIFDKASLLTINSKKEEHIRYKNVIDQFYIYLKLSLKETQEAINEHLKPTIQSEKNTNISTKFNITFVEVTNSHYVNNERTQTYHYEMGKLGSNRNREKFNFYSSLLKQKCSDNKLVIDELNHMSQNLNNDIEFYSSYYLIQKELKIKRT